MCWSAYGLSGDDMVAALLCRPRVLAARSRWRSSRPFPSTSELSMLAFWLRVAALSDTQSVVLDWAACLVFLMGLPDVTTDSIRFHIYRREVWWDNVLLSFDPDEN
jgi:hypothetical protein